MVTLAQGTLKRVETVVNLFSNAFPLTVGTLTDGEFFSQAEEFTEQCDWIELRLDHLHPRGQPKPHLEVPTKLPVLITARGPEEGGANSLSLTQRQLLCEYYLEKASAIDIEARQLHVWTEWIQTNLKHKEIAIIASYHDFDGTPNLDECEAIANEAFARGAHLVKFAFHLKSFTDMQLGLDLLGIAFPGPIAAMGMGPLAPVSRLLYAQHGSRLNYGYLGDTEAAPGQWPASLLKAGITHLQPIVPRHA